MQNSMLAALVAFSGCGSSTPSVTRLNPPSMYGSPRHVNVVVVRGGRTIYIGGQAPVDAGGQLVGRGDFRAQVDQAFSNLGEALSAAGTGYRDVVQLRTYLVAAPALDLDAYRQARERTFGAFHEKPVATTVMVSGLTLEGALIVVDAVAAVAD